MLAFEITKRLEAADGFGAAQVLGSLNLPPHTKTRMRQLHWNNRFLHLVYSLGLTTEEHAEEIEDSGFEPWSATPRLSEAERMEELGLDRPSLIRWTDVAYDLPRMATDCELHGDVDILDAFCANTLKGAAAPNKEECRRTHLSKWEDYCRSDSRFHKVGGAHYTMIGQDHVLAFTSKLRSALHARGV